MNKKILISLGVIVFASAVIIGATGAFFSDTETSTGNTFTAGSIDLKVDDTQHYNGMICELNGSTADLTDYWWRHEGNNAPAAWPVEYSACNGTWLLKDLVPTQDKFFNFTDVKPGDSGENTISLHVDNNAAYACADLSNIKNDDNTHLVPETLAGDTTPGPTGQGELGQGLDFLIWNDTNGNNVWDANEVGQNTTGGAPLTNQTYTLADGSGPAIPATGTSYLGLAWCAGTFTAGGPGTPPVCDGSTMGNEAQTDSYAADIGIRVVQARNNSAFRCAPLTNGQVAPIVVGANDLETVLANSAASGKWYFYNDTTDALNNTLGGFVGGPGTPPLGTGSAVVNPLATAGDRTLLANSQFGGTLLSSISALSFSYYQPVPGTWSSSESPFLRFNVDFNNSASIRRV